MMKTTSWLLLVLLHLPLFLSAQSPLVADFFEQYKDQDDYNSLNIEGSLLGLMSKDKSNTNGISLKSMQLLNAPLGQGPVDQRVIDRFIQRLAVSRFEELPIENSGSGNIQFFMDEKNGIISELVMVLQSSEGYTVLSLRGHIPLDEIKQLDAEIDIDGLEEL